MTGRTGRICMDCRERIVIPPARHGNGRDRESYYRLHVRYQVRCAPCARRLAWARLSHPATKAHLDRLYRHGLRGVTG